MAKSELVGVSDVAATVQATTPVVKPRLWPELKALVAQGLAEGPFEGHGVEESKSYLNLINGFTVPGVDGQGDAVYAAHPEDADAFIRGEDGKILVWYLKAERKYCAVRRCAANPAVRIVVRTSDLMFKRTAAGGARRSGGGTSHLTPVQLPADLD